jgi:hypothetical protein
MNRVFVDVSAAQVADRTQAPAILAPLKAGHAFASNGPLLGLLLGGRKPGDTLSMGLPGKQSYQVALRSPVAVDHLELVHNGRVLKRFDLNGDRRVFDARGEIDIAEGGWLLLRAWNDMADPQLLDLYPYATTNPVWLDLPSGPPSAADDARYFVAWLDRVITAAGARDDYNSARERQDTLDYLRAARALFQRKAGGN